jgi:hypothetical protein
MTIYPSRLKADMGSASTKQGAGHSQDTSDRAMINLAATVIEG